MIKDLFGHVVIGDTKDVLGKVRTDPEINGALLRQEPSEELKQYLQDLTFSDIALREDFTKAYTYASIKGFITFDPNKSDEISVGQILSEGFPVREGFDAFAADVTDVLNAFCKATGYREVNAYFFLSVPCGTGCWHHDNDTDVRGFKAYRSDGPLLRANETITKWRPGVNSYGMPVKTKLPEGTVSQMLEGDFGIWKGDVHERPLIHVKPAVAEGEFRLTMHIDPPTMAYRNMLKENGWQRFYKEPSP